MQVRALRSAIPATVEERVARGRAARAKVARSTQAKIARDDVVDPISILERQAVSRVPELVPLRYGRMSVSPFTFYRGAAAVMAADLAGTPNSGLPVQACGDAHLLNFGAYQSPERRLVFDINDFDETLPGPWEWDAKRLSASLVIAGRDRGFGRSERESAVLSAALAYREAMASFAEMRNLEVWYARLEVDDMVEQLGAAKDSTAVRRVERQRTKALSRDSVQAYAKMTELVDGQPRFRADPPLIERIEGIAGAGSRAAVMETLGGLLKSYRRTLVEDRRRVLDSYRLVDIARKVVGVGSVGTRAWVLLLLGRDDHDPLILQAKEAQSSVLEPYGPRSEFTNAGQRVVVGQRLMQATSDIFLGWQRVPGIDGVERDFYVRQLRDGKASAVVETMNAKSLALYARACGWTLARAHARSGDRIAISTYLGRGDTIDRALVSFGEAYADQNEKDYAALVEAIRVGRLEAVTGI